MNTEIRKMYNQLSICLAVYNYKVQQLPFDVQHKKIKTVFYTTRILNGGMDSSRWIGLEHF